MSAKSLEQEIRKIIKMSLFESVDTETAFDKDSTTELIAQQKASKIADHRKQIHKAKAGSKKSEDTMEEDGAPDENPKVDLQELPDISPDQIAQKINQIRAGKSLKDKGALNNLTNYFQRLNGPERIALYAFLQGLAKVIGGADGGDVKVPASKPYRVDIERELSKSKPSPVKKSTKSHRSSSSGDSDRDSTPIVVGESANKSRELRIIKANRA